jgi:biotin carboxyl carrier protein
MSWIIPGIFFSVQFVASNTTDTLMPEEKFPCKVKVNEFEFPIERETVKALDIIRRTGSEYHLVFDNRSLNAKVIEADPSGKQLKVEVNGDRFDVLIQDELEQMLDKMGFNSVSTRHAREIKAPMPGMVLEVSVTEGQEVNEGERILILEAMKMENSIMISTNARIKKILIRAGEPVDKGQVLVELE